MTKNKKFFKEKIVTLFKFIEGVFLGLGLIGTMIVLLYVFLGATLAFANGMVAFPKYGENFALIVSYSTKWLVFLITIGGYYIIKTLILKLFKRRKKMKND